MVSVMKKEHILSKKKAGQSLAVIMFFSSIVFSASVQSGYALIDAHSHYAHADTLAISPKEVVETLDRNKIEKILITSTPNSGTTKLLNYAPERVIPFLSVYQTKADKRDWMYQTEVIDRAKADLKTGQFVGIGELHIFAKDKKSPVLKGLVELANEQELPMLIHADAQVIDEIFQIDPDARVLWAHLGTQPEISLLQSMLDKYPQNLWIDTSVRDKQLLATGRLGEDWKAFFTAYPDRFLVAIDTFSVNRWKTYDSVVEDIQTWLQDLPIDVANRLAKENAQQFFRVEIK